VPARRNEAHWRASTALSDAAPPRLTAGRQQETPVGTVLRIILVLMLRSRAAGYGVNLVRIAPMVIDGQ